MFCPFVSCSCNPSSSHSGGDLDRGIFRDVCVPSDTYMNAAKDSTLDHTLII